MRLPLAIIMVVLLLAPAAGSPLQTGDGPGRHNGVSVSGPEWGDTAFVLEQDWQTFDQSFHVNDRELYYYHEDRGTQVDMISALNVDTGITTNVTELPVWIDDFVLDDEAIYTLGRNRVMRHVDDQIEWSIKINPRDVPVDDLGGSAQTACSKLVVAHDALFVACNYNYLVGAGLLVVASIDKNSGEVLWQWERRQETSTQFIVDEAAAQSGPDQGLFLSVSLAVHGETVAVLEDRVQILFDAYDVDGVQSGAANGEGSRYWDAWTINRASGQWIDRFSQPVTSFYIPLPPTGYEPARPAGCHGWIFLPATDLAGLVANRLTIVFANNGTQAGQLIVGADPIRVACSSNRIFVSDGQNLQVYSPDLEIVSSQPLPFDLLLHPHGFKWADNRLYFVGHPRDSTPEDLYRAYLYAAGENGEVIWSRALPSSANMRIGDGFMAVVDDTDKTIIVGKTNQSIALEIEISDQLPQPGDEVTIGITAAGGLSANGTEFMVDWGDGDITLWNQSSQYSHRYTAPDDFTARVFVRNDAGQSSSVPIQFLVGQQRELTWVQSQFSAENQERTFFILGLLITLGFAFVGFVKLRSSQARVSRQLRTLENTVRDLHNNPIQIEQIFNETVEQANNELARGKIDHAQYLVIKDRIDELRKRFRLSQLDSRLAYLPLGMVEQLHDILRDGEVTQLERDHFMTALERDELMDGQQKAQLKQLIKQWFEIDLKSQAS